MLIPDYLAPVLLFFLLNQGCVIQLFQMMEKLSLAMGGWNEYMERSMYWVHGMRLSPLVMGSFTYWSKRGGDG